MFLYAGQSKSEEDEKASQWKQRLQDAGLVRYRVTSDKGYFVDLEASSVEEALAKGQKWFDDRDRERRFVGAEPMMEKVVSVEEIK